eukprot:CAMPEP_0206526486 /NCGR_PEP_ID=MMETSP0325_2-20121206/769_1 /ASSEMBLY_ACC=CAM_ASM_000347 /TAXON_ID=2866 /ORGANISM="Crypthecodinium cohnii, Strain Seligo" /LENGTH=376 /DNA_ID=CAMNT_0054021689 /DNA_START=600 /DNA_END=1727 /DNA_ORIENTATION=-
MEAAKSMFKVPLPPEVDTLKVLDVTTVMFRYIPRRFTDGDVLQALEKSVKREAFDYVYVPWSATSTSNMGYAFANFVDPHIAHAAMALFDKASWKCVGTRTPMKVEPAHVQGLAANVLRSTTSKARVFHSGVEIPLEVAIEMQRGQGCSDGNKQVQQQPGKKTAEQEESKTSSSTTTSSGEDWASADPASSSDGSWRRSITNRERVEQINAHPSRSPTEATSAYQPEVSGSPCARMSWMDNFDGHLAIARPSTSLGVTYTLPEEILTPMPHQDSQMMHVQMEPQQQQQQQQPQPQYQQTWLQQQQQQQLQKQQLQQSRTLPLPPQCDPANKFQQPQQYQQHQQQQPFLTMSSNCSQMSPDQMQFLQMQQQQQQQQQ